MRRLNDKGSALVLVVFTMLIVFFLGFALLEVSTIDFAMSNNQVDGVKAYYIAEAGMNKVIASLLYNQDLQQQMSDTLQNVGDTMVLSVAESFGGGSFTDGQVKLKSKTTENKVIEIEISGSYSNAVKKLVAQGRMSFGQMDQFIASDTAVICVEQFSTKNGSLYVDGNVFSLGGIDCGWGSTIKGDTFGYGNVSVVQGTVDGNLYGTGNVYLGWNANVAGDVTGRGAITVDGGNDIGGEVFGSGAVWLKWDADVGGSVKSLSSIKMEGANNVEGDIFGVGLVELDGQSEIAEGVISLNNLILGGANDIYGNLFASGTVSLGNDDDINGCLTALGNLTMTGANNITGDVLSFGTLTTGGSSIFEGNVYGANNIDMGWSSQVTGNVLGNQKVTIDGSSTVNGSVFAGNGVEIGDSSMILGQLVESGPSIIKGSVTVSGDFYTLGDIELSWNDRFQGNVVCFGTITDGGGCNFSQNIFGNTVEMKKSGTNVTGNIYYVNNFETKRNLPYTAAKINSSQMPTFPSVPTFPVTPVPPTAPEPPEIKTFPGIPDVKVKDYQGQPGTKTITSADLTSGRLDMSTLTSGVYYVDDSIANLQIYGNYSGVISLVSKGKITVYSNVLRTDTIDDALMLLSFKNSTSDSAIYLEWNTTVDALLFAPLGIISDHGTPTINGGVMGNIVNIGWSGRIYHIESILNKFGLGNTGIESIEIMNWRETSGML